MADIQMCNCGRFRIGEIPVAHPRADCEAATPSASRDTLSEIERVERESELHEAEVANHGPEREHDWDQVADDLSDHTRKLIAEADDGPPIAKNDDQLLGLVTCDRCNTNYAEGQYDECPACYDVDGPSVDDEIAQAEADLTAGMANVLNPRMGKTPEYLKPHDQCPKCGGRLWPKSKGRQVECDDCGTRWPTAKAEAKDDVGNAAWEWDEVAARQRVFILRQNDADEGLTAWTPVGMRVLVRTLLNDLDHLLSRDSAEVERQKARHQQTKDWWRRKESLIAAAMKQLNEAVAWTPADDEVVVSQSGEQS